MPDTAPPPAKRPSPAKPYRFRFTAFTPLQIVAALVILFFSALMVRIVWQYTAFQDNVDFLKLKRQVLHIQSWKAAFYVHVFSSGVVLFAGLMQFSKWLMHNYPKLHRGVGLVYVADILLLAGPSGFLMAFYANGGFAGRVAFVTQASLWLVVTFVGYRKAVQGRYLEHGEFLLRSYALALSALTLRAQSYLLVKYADIHPDDIYIAISWASWVFNLFIAEALIHSGYVKRLLRNPS